MCQAENFVKNWQNAGVGWGGGVVLFASFLQINKPNFSSEDLVKHLSLKLCQTNLDYNSALLFHERIVMIYLDQEAFFSF